MALQYHGDNEARRQAVSEHATLNGVDYLEVLDQDAPTGSPRQQTLLVRCLKEVPTDLSSENVLVEGGVRVSSVEAEWAVRADDTADLLSAGSIDAAENALFNALAEADHVLVVRTNTTGDFSTYAFSLVESSIDSGPPVGFDPILSRIDFSFKVECPSEFDCKSEADCPTHGGVEPPIDYLAKDYSSFRRLMLDRLSLTMPEWTERNPADLGVALVELLAYAADQLSYYQDAVATEAYLGTAHKRVSVRRHARLLDYHMHDGSNSRAWVCLSVSAGSGADGYTLPAQTPMLTRTNAPLGVLHPEDYTVALDAGPRVFETMHDLTLRAAHSEIAFHTWGDDRCCLPAGATQATLNNEGDALPSLVAGDVLVFEEILGPASGRAVDADRTHRHAVRLTKVNFTEDPLYVEADDPSQILRVVDIQWAPVDALDFPLCISAVVEGETVQNVSIARGKVVLADHGRTVAAEDLDEVTSDNAYRPRLAEGPITNQGRVRDGANNLVLFDEDAPAAGAMAWEMRNVRPAISLAEADDESLPWLPQQDLLSSDRFAREFVAEIEDDGYARLRFGDGVLGREPAGGSGLAATYRVGNARAGNVGAEAIVHVVSNVSGIESVRNPEPSQGGTAPETIDQVVENAPQAFRTQERAVTADDYATAAERHPEVQRAMATPRWTGSWHTMFVTVDRAGGLPVDAEFEVELREFLERFRMAGYDLEIDAPRFVPLDIAMTVCVEPGRFRADVKEALLETFSNRELSDGALGFFHPDNLTFGQPVYLSQVVAAAMEVPGVRWVNTTAFHPWGREQADELDEGLIATDRLEIALLDNDPNAPENGKIEFTMEGGL